MSGSDMKDLATLATILAKPEMERVATWRPLIGRDHWALILIRHEPKGSPPAKRRPTNRLSADWLRRVGADLPIEQQMQEWISRYMQAAEGDDLHLSQERAASAAVDAVMPLLDHPGVELPASPKEADR